MSRIAYWFAAPARGDAVVIRSPETPDRVEMKRILGLPEDTVTWAGGRFQINGGLSDEPYARPHAIPPGDDEVRSVRLGVGEYFVAGDNRLYSRDSRAYGVVPRSSLIGKILS